MRRLGARQRDCAHCLTGWRRSIEDPSQEMSSLGTRRRRQHACHAGGTRPQPDGAVEEHAIPTPTRGAPRKCAGPLCRACSCECAGAVAAVAPLSTSPVSTPALTTSQRSVSSTCQRAVAVGCLPAPICTQIKSKISRGYRRNCRHAAKIALTCALSRAT